VEPVTILLVEDETLLRIDFENALAEAGFNVAEASSGQQATELLNAEAFGVQGLITDIRLGEPIDGWEIARAAREIDAEMAVVYISGSATEDDWAVQGVPNSILLAKPFAMAQLVTAISQLLNARSQGPAAS
jgi:two-component system, cell cycle response regulator CpdR